jgi:predicted phosphodiesterase
MEIPESTRQPERSWKSFAWNISIALAIAALTVSTGMALIAIGYFTKLLASFVPSIKTAATALLVAYLFACAVFFGIRQFSEALAEVVGTVDRSVSRLLGFLVVGGSDLCRGSRTAAWCIYVLIAGTSFGLAIAFALFFVDGTDAGRNAWAVLTGKAKDSTPTTEVWLAGAILSIAAVIACVPLGMVFRREWWKMAIKPRIAVGSWKSRLAEVDRPVHRFRIAHVSDAHVEAGHTCAATGSVRSTLQQASDENVDVVAITGDITDIGTHEQWNQFLGLPEVNCLRDKLVLSPGNHDLNPVHEHDVVKSLTYVESPRRTETHKRALNYLRAATLVMGNRCKLICPYTGSWATLVEVMERATADIALWEQNARLHRNSLTPIELLERLFPMAVFVDGVEAAFLVWNSVWLARWPINNSMGDISSTQLSRADKIIAHLGPLLPVVHLMHHQVGVPNTKPHASYRSKKVLDSFYPMGMGVRNPQDLLDWISRRRQQTLILHGHRHKYFVAKETEHDITIVSSPSVSKMVEHSWDATVPAGGAGHWLCLGLQASGPNVQLTDVKPVVPKAKLPVATPVSPSLSETSDAQRKNDTQLL